MRLGLDKERAERLGLEIERAEKIGLKNGRVVRLLRFGEAKERQN